MIGSCFRPARYLVFGRSLLFGPTKTEIQINPAINLTSIATRMFSQKKSRQQNDPADLRSLGQPDPIEEAKKNRKKTPPIPQIYVRDEKGRLLGLMTLPEAVLLANKHKRVLIKTDVSKKIPTYKFQDPRLVADSEQKIITDDDILSESDSKTATKKGGTAAAGVPKTVAFTCKASEHDLAVKMNQVKKFLHKGQEILVRVTSGGDLQRLEEIFNQFSALFNEQNGARINQKRLSETLLKFHILPVDIELIRSRLPLAPDYDNDPIIDLSQVDPNRLLEDETIIDRLKKK